MDKIKIITIALLLILVGCKKETVEETITKPESTTTVDCKCGRYELTGRNWDMSGNVSRYFYTAYNNCTNAPIRFETRTEFTDAEYCLTFQW